MALLTEVEGPRLDFPLAEGIYYSPVLDRPNGLQEIDPELHAQHLPFLTSEESLVKAVKVTISTRSDNPLSSLEALMMLTHASSIEEIGRNGPPMASCSTPENADKVELNAFNALFGRDALISSSILLLDHPELARTTILSLAKYQGIEEGQGTDDYIRRDEEPGAILHEQRSPGDPIYKSLVENGWRLPYFGTVDATPLYIQAVTAYTRAFGNSILKEIVVGRDGREHTIEESYLQAIDWLRRRMDQNDEGFVEYKRKFAQGLQNQAWMDSWDAYFHADGTYAKPTNSIASVEVQALAYDALLDAAELYQDLNPSLAQDLTERADKLRKNVLEKMWVKDERGEFFALGTERFQATGELKPFKVRKSNMGRLLNSRILEGDDEETKFKREETIKLLFSEEMLAATGIRTLSNKEPHFRPTAYHNGAVWSIDNFLIAEGVERHGYYTAAWNLYKRNEGVHEESGVFPEFTKGTKDPTAKFNEGVVMVFNAKEQCDNCVEQPAQEIMVWAVAQAIAIEKKRQQGETATTDPDKIILEKEILSKAI